MALSSNIASIGANHTFLNTNAHNIANTNTDGFVPNRTLIKENGSGDPQAVVSQSDDNKSQHSQTDLSKELTDQVVIENVNGANISAIKTQDEMLGSLLDIKA